MTASSQSITAFILAGSRPGKPDPVALAGGVSHKALLPIGGVPMLLRVIDALQQVPQITRIAVCIENPQIIASILPAGIDVIPARPEGPSASVLAGLARYGTPLLVTTADNALLQPSWVQELLSESHTQADLAVAVATETTVKRDVPNTQRTYIRLADRSILFGCAIRVILYLWLDTRALHQGLLNLQSLKSLLGNEGISPHRQQPKVPLSSFSLCTRAGARAGVVAAPVQPRALTVSCPMHDVPPDDRHAARQPP